MKRPKVLNILGHRVEILPLPVQSDDVNVGMASTRGEIIYIEDSLPNGV